jgi:hypothetical protein
MTGHNRKPAGSQWRKRLAGLSNRKPNITIGLMSQKSRKSDTFNGIANTEDG